MSFPRASTEPGSAWGPQNKTQSWVHLQVGARENIRLDTFSCAWGKKKKKPKSNWLNKGGSSLSRMERSPEAGGQLAWCDQWVRNHYWLCPLASSPSGYMRATRVPMSPVDMTTSRVIEGPCPLRSFSWEPPLCSPSEDFPSLFPWPEPGHVSLLSQVPWGRLSGHRGCW